MDTPNQKHVFKSTHGIIWVGFWLILPVTIAMAFAVMAFINDGDAMILVVLMGLFFLSLVYAEFRLLKILMTEPKRVELENDTMTMWIGFKKVEVMVPGLLDLTIERKILRQRRGALEFFYVKFTDADGKPYHLKLSGHGGRAIVEELNLWKTN